MKYGERKTVLRDAARRNILVRVYTVRLVYRNGCVRYERGGCAYIEMPSYTSTRGRDGRR